MKARVLILAATALAGFGGCSESSIVTPVDPDYSRYPLDTFDCPQRVITPTGYRPALFGHTPLGLTADRKWLVYKSSLDNVIRLVNLGSLSERRIDLQQRLPDNVRLRFLSDVIPCRYNSDLLLVQCVTATDTTGDGLIDAAGTNVYIVSIDGSGCDRVTPGIYGESGTSGSTHIYVWLNTRAGEPDSLLGAFDGLGQRIYLPATDTFIAAPFTWIHNRTGDGSRLLRFVPGLVGSECELYLNDVAMPFSVGPVVVSTPGSFSPDNRKLALLVVPNAPDSVVVPEEIWVVDIDRYLRERPPVADVQVINLQDRFCTYDAYGPVFVSNYTLAVAMRRDDEETHFIWEITTDGRRVRQLTRVP